MQSCDLITFNFELGLEMFDLHERCLVLVGNSGGLPVLKSELFDLELVVQDFGL